MGGFNFGNIAKAFGNKKNGTTTTTGTTSTPGTTAKAPITVSGTVVSNAPSAGVAAPTSQPTRSAPVLNLASYKAPPVTAPTVTAPKRTPLVGSNAISTGYKAAPTTTPTWSRADLPQNNAPTQVSGTVVSQSKAPTAVKGTVVDTTKSSAPPTYTGSTIGNTPLMSGAINYATADKAGRQQIVANQSRIKNDPNYVNSEINRTLQVIQDRQAQGLDVSGQAKYLYTNLGYQGALNGNQTQAAEQANQYALTEEQLEAMARAELEKQLAELQAQAAQQKAAIQAQYDYANGITQDNRTLENLQFDRVNAPTNWDGSTGYRGAMLDRNRSIQDTQTQLQLQSALAAADQQVADFQSQMPSLVAARAGELKQQERAYDLDYAGVYGAGLGGQQTLQAQEADRNYGLNYANTYGVGQNGQQTASYQNQLFNQNMQTNEMLGSYLPTGAREAISQIISLKQQAETRGITAQQRAALSQQSDALRSQLTSMGINPDLFGSGVSAAQAVQNLQTISAPTQSAYQYANNLAYQQSRDQVGDAQWDITFQYQKARDAIADTQWRQQFDRNVLEYGMNYALQELQRQDDNAYRSATLALSQDDNARQWATLDYDMANASAGATPEEYSGMSASQVLSALQSQFADPDTKKVPTDTKTKESIYQQVASFGLPIGTDDQVMLALGLTSKDIQSFDKKYGANTGK